MEISKKITNAANETGHELTEIGENLKQLITKAYAREIAKVYIRTYHYFCILIKYISMTAHKHKHSPACRHEHRQKQTRTHIHSLAHAERVREKEREGEREREGRERMRTSPNDIYSERFREKERDLSPWPPCTYNRPPADVKPWRPLADGRRASSAAERLVQVMVAGSKACRSSRRASNDGGRQEGWGGRKQLMKPYQMTGGAAGWNKRWDLRGQGQGACRSSRMPGDDDGDSDNRICGGGGGGG
jgi:hypothetical protein